MRGGTTLCSTASALGPVSDMNITFVSPPFGEHGQKSKGLPIAPPVLEYLAGLAAAVRPDVAVSLVDANKTIFDPHTVSCDLVGFTVLTPQAPWVYRQADILRERGVPVVFGGIHVRAKPEEAKLHADAVVVGEAEQILGKLLEDLDRGRLDDIYHAELPPLENLPRPTTGLLPDRYPFGSFFTARGCPHRCRFCSVHDYFGNQVRFRPIDEVVSEVAASNRRLFWNIDDNIWGTDIDRSIELYKAMAAGIGAKWWFGSADLITAQHSRADEMLRWCRRAGCTAVLVGFESQNPRTLEELGAATKQGANRLDAIKRIRDHGMEVMLFIMVGSRTDRRQDYEEILDFCLRHKVAAHPVMTTPFPGTELYDLYRPHLREGLDWGWFDGNHAVYEHDDPEMSVLFREQALVALRSDLFQIGDILKRITRISVRGFPMSHITSWMLQYPQGRAFREFARVSEEGSKSVG